MINKNNFILIAIVTVLNLNASERYKTEHTPLLTELSNDSLINISNNSQNMETNPSLLLNIKKKEILKKIKENLAKKDFTHITDIINQNLSILDKQKGSIINQAIDSNSNTLLHIALRENNLAFFIFLLENNASVDIKNLNNTAVIDLIFNKPIYQNAVQRINENLIRNKEYTVIPIITINKDPKPNYFAIKSGIACLAILPTILYLIYLGFNLSIR